MSPFSNVDHSTIDEPKQVPSEDQTTWDQLPANAITKSEVLDSSAESEHDASVLRNPVDILADEFAARLRRGETPSIDEYVDRAPKHAAAIRAIFPSIALLEGAGQHRQQTDHHERRIQKLALTSQETLGDFRIVRELGRGGMGVVYEAEQQSLKRRVALKVLHPNIALSDRQRHRFQREAESAAQLHHTNIVPVFAVGEQQGLHFYAMQFIDGLPLSTVIRRLVGRQHTLTHLAETPTDIAVPKTSWSLPEVNPQQAAESPTIIASQQHQALATESARRAAVPTDSVSEAQPGLEMESLSLIQAARITLQVCQALAYAHQHGMLHRDIKPANLMLDRAGNVWITDFGLVKLVDGEDLTGTGDVVGTVRYMAPEQLEGRADARTDLYSVGLTLFELCTFKPAFDGDQSSLLGRRLRHLPAPRSRAFNRAIPQDLDVIIGKATATEPAARYQSAAELADDLQRFLDDRPIRARRESLAMRWWRWSRRNPALASATALAVLALTLVAIVEWRGRLNVEAALQDTDIERGRAESNVDLAIEAFDSILENVTSRGVPTSLALDVPASEAGLNRTSLSVADAELLSRLLGFYRQFAQRNADNLKLRERIAQADQRAGLILVRLGRLDDAEQEFRRALELLSSLRASDPQRVSWLVMAAQIHNDLGELLLRRGEFRDTFDAHVDALSLFAGQPESVMADPNVRFERARATDLFASIDIRSGTDQAPSDPGLRGSPRRNGGGLGERERHRGPEHGPREFGLPPELAPDSPPHGDREPPHGPHDHGGPRRELPSVMRSAPRQEHQPPDERPGFPATMKQHREPMQGLAATLFDACQQFRSLVHEHPQNPQFQFQLAQCLRHRLVHMAAMRDAAAAQAAFLEAVQVLEQLVERFPYEPKYLFELADTLSQAARAQTPTEAQQSLRRATDISQQLATRFPDVSEYQLLWGTALARRANNEQVTSNSTSAVTTLQQSIEILARLGQRFSDQGVIQIPLAKTRCQLAELLRSADNNQRPARDRLEHAQQIIEQALRDFETYYSHTDGRTQFNTDVRQQLVRSRDALAKELEPK